MHPTEHPTDGVLRRLLDQPGGVSDRHRRHVALCDRCLAALGAMSASVDASGATTSPPVPTALLSAVRSSRGRARAARFLRRPAVAVVAVVATLAAGGTAAANDWLTIFQSERIVAVELTASDLMALPDLHTYGHLEVASDLEVQTVPDAATAAAETGLDVPEVTSLPRGVSGQPAYRVSGEVAATFTFSPQRAAEAAARAGTALPPHPPGLDGTQLRLLAGPGLVATWSQGTGVPSLVLGRAVAPTASSSGLPLETVRDYLLSLPGLSGDAAAQLRTFTADGSTVPLPLPADHVTSSTSEVGGVPATVVAARDGSLAAVVWVDDGVVTAVAGALSTDEVLSVARGLR